MQRLTADLSGLQFNDLDAFLRNIQPATGGGAAAVAPSPPAQTGATRLATSANKTLPDEFDSGNKSASLSSNASDRDTKETNEDAALLKRYKITHLVGTGNYARVYRALSASGRELAVKSINLSKTSENYKQKFLPRELTILKKINHVNICKIYEIIQIADRIFILMQFCTRGTIADLLQKNAGPLNERVARYLFGQTVDAVAYLHSIDVAHRDLKIENILLDSEYNPKLTDFSYSVQVRSSSSGNNSVASKSVKNHSHNQSHRQNSHQLNLNLVNQSHGKSGGMSRVSLRLNDTFCGTLPYLSPEMIRQFPYDSKKTDIWSLGICLYVMLNDRLPFPFSDIKLMIRRQLTREYKFKANLEISDLCKDLMTRLLEPDFSRRATSLEVSRHNWLNGVREKPVAVSPEATTRT